MIDKRLAFICVALLTLASWAGAQTWTPLAHQPSFSAATAHLLTDGTVMVQALESGAWWRLTPDNTGSYINGTWSQLASMPSGYGPLYFASAVLPDGRVVVEGGEYNNSGAAVWTTLGAIYNPTTNSWTSIAPPSGWTTIGDAQSVVLPNGTFMLANCCTTQSALLNPSNLTWTITGSGKTGNNDEEGWTLLPSGKVLAVDANNLGNLTNSEIYDPAIGTWSNAGSTIVKLPDTNSDGSGSREMGPAVLRPDGTVFATGGTSNTAVYNTISGGWSVGPTFSSGLDIADGPAALLPNGNVLVDASPGIFNAGSQFFEFNGSNLISVPAAPNTGSDPSYVGRMLVLPTGQIFFTHHSSQVQVYTPTGTYQNTWQPAITSVAGTLNAGSTNNSISGTQFNGLSQGGAYGDDAQSATNYPLVRITNNATGHVAYARTHNHSTMGVATGSAIVSTQFDVPATVDIGASTLQIVANGIPSNGVAVTIAQTQSAGCPETTCILVQNAYISHFTGANCTGAEHYYTPYFSSDGIRRSWDGKGFYGTTLSTVTNISWKGTDGVCHNDWPSGNTLSGFVSIYRDTQFTPVQAPYISHFTDANCAGQESYYTPYFSSDGIRRSWNGLGSVGSILYTATNKSWKGSDGACHNDWPSGNTLSGFVHIYR
jgi:hypothetical protein